jgi:hypothetical protein
MEQHKRGATQALGSRSCPARRRADRQLAELVGDEDFRASCRRMGVAAEHERTCRKKQFASESSILMLRLDLQVFMRALTGYNYS